jgi:hypothetical protein
MAIFWFYAPHKVVEEIDKHLRGAYCVHNQGDWVSLYQSTRCSFPEDSFRHSRRRENLKSHVFLFICRSDP